MIARLFIALPFHLVVPEGQQFTLYSYCDDGCLIIVHPPGKTDVPAPGDTPDVIKVDGAPAFIANGLQIDFQKDLFDRTAGRDIDPPMALIQRVVDSFVTRLRYVTKAAHIHPLRWPHVSWRVRYLNDDGSELQEEKGLVRGRGAIGISLSMTAMSTEVWNHVYSLPPDFEPPAWDTIRLDAGDATRHVGTAVVLGATCLEVFVTHTLDVLAQKSTLSPELWQWINDRGNWLRDPSTEEQFDILLKVLTGHSLKENSKLWEAFKNLKDARNSFVHEGTARIGGKPVSETDVLRLIVYVNEIIALLRQWLPEDLRWPEFDLKTQMQFEKKII